MLAKLGTSRSSTCADELKSVVWSGVAQALPHVRRPSVTAILIDRGQPHIAEQAHDAGVCVAIALERSGADTLRGEAPVEDLRRDLRELRPSYGKVLIRWGADDPADRRRRQLASLRRMSGLVDETEAELLVELLITAATRPAADSLSWPAWEESVLPRLQCEAVADILEGGIRPALWKIEGHPNARAASLLGDLVGSATPDAALLILGGGRRIPELSRCFACRPGSERLNGFAVGRSIWQDPIAALWRGEFDISSASEAVRDNFLAVISVFESAIAVREPTC